MATDHNQHHAHHADVSYEKSDLSHRGILAFFAFLGISALVIFVAIGALYKGFDYAEAKLAPPVHPMAQSMAMNTEDKMQNTGMVDLQRFSANGTQPLLQVNEPADLQTFLREESTLLNAAPWKDDKGNIHLPIDRAMQLVAQRSMPVRSNPSDPAVVDPNTVPTEAGFAGIMQVHQAADASAAGAVEPTGVTPASKPEPHSITPSGKKNTDMPEKK